MLLLLYPAAGAVSAAAGVVAVGAGVLPPAGVVSADAAPLLICI